MYVLESGLMRHTDLLERGASESEIQSFLAEGSNVPVTIRIPSNPRDSAKEAASMTGMSYSAFVRMCIIEKLSKRK
jgi:predicted DNA binding CopG/RHH family protein